MKIEKIEFKNIFSYGEAVQTINYSDEGKLILLKGRSGAGKSAILSLPVLLLYGKIVGGNKSDIANRVNKHGWIRGTLTKNKHTYVIEREFSPNSIKIWKDDIEVDCYGASAAEEYISTEIVDVPINTFTNMITISMDNFTSFLKMSPSDKKKVIDEVFDVSIVNMVFDQLKKDAKELGNRINGDNGTLFSLNQTVANANSELMKIQQKNASPEDVSKIEENNTKIEELNKSLLQYNDVMKQVNEKSTQNSTDVFSKRQQITENQMVIKTINEKINLFNQSKCPTCSTPFTGEVYDELKKKLQELLSSKTEKDKTLNKELSELNEKSQKIQAAVKKVNDGMYQIRVNINNLQADNRIINEKMKASAEYQGIQNIIDETSKQISEIKDSIDEKTKQLLMLQKLMVVYSIDGVTKMVIENYLPLLNQEIAENLLMLGYPYNLEFDSQFNAKITDCGMNVGNTLSRGEKSRLDTVIVLSLLKLLKRKMPDLNLVSFDETVSSLPPEDSSPVLAMMKMFAEEQNLNIIVVSHTELETDCFDEMIKVDKDNGFSHIDLIEFD